MVARAEIEHRIARLQAALPEDGLDGAVVVQDVDLFYLAGTAQSAHSYLVVDHGVERPTSAPEELVEP